MAAGEGGEVPKVAPQVDQSAAKALRAEATSEVQAPPPQDTSKNPISVTQDQQLADLANQDPPVVEAADPAAELIDRANLVSPEPGGAEAPIIVPPVSLQASASSEQGGAVEEQGGSIPVEEASQEKEREGIASENEQAQEEPAQMPTEEASVREFLDKGSEGAFSQFSPEQQKMLVNEFTAARQRMPEGRDRNNLDDVKRFILEEKAKNQAGGVDSAPEAQAPVQPEPPVSTPPIEGAEPEPVPAPPAPVAPAAEVPTVVPEAGSDAEASAKTEATKGAAREGEGMTPPSTERAPEPTDAEKIKQKVDAALQGNKEYQAAKQALEGDENKRWQEIDALMATQEVQGEAPQEKAERVRIQQDAQDSAIENLSKKDRKAYEAFVEQREGVHMTEKHAEWDAREKQLNDLEEEIKTLFGGAERIHKENKLRDGRKALEADRRSAEASSALAGNAHYQELKRKYRKAENDLMELYMTPDDKGNKRTKEQAEDMVRDLAGKKWEDLSGAQREAFGGNEALFNKSYSFDRSVMNGLESQARNKIDLARIEKGVNPDGSQIPPDQIAARTQEYYESRISDKRRGPGNVRKIFKGFARGIDKWFGVAEMNDHGKKGLGHARSLADDYGWKGFFAQWLLPKEKRATAKNLRSLMRRELGAYFVRFGLRKPLQFIGLSLLFWIVTPIVIGKGLELTKPFGGGQ